MDIFRLQGGPTLRGPIHVSGAKNACLPIMAAALLAKGESRLSFAPDLADVRTLGLVLAHVGMRVSRGPGGLRLDATTIDHAVANYDLVRQMRASILVLGPLLARCGSAEVSLPGGCAIGARPIDQHLAGLAALGATIRQEHGYVHASAEGGLRGARFRFAMCTCTGTENVLLASTLARGTTVLENCALEPEVGDLIDVLTNMGARIRGKGTHTLTIEGQPELQPFAHRLMPDRIEAGTLLVAGALLGDDLQICNADPSHLGAAIEVLRSAGVTIDAGADNCLHVARAKTLRPQSLTTAPYPGLPTDLQAQFMVLLTQAAGNSDICETIFDNRFMHVAELNRLGADIRSVGNLARVHGPTALSGTTVMATDLRASASLVLAGLIAEGETCVRRIYHLDRGYERLEAKLSAVGANIVREREA